MRAGLKEQLRSYIRSIRFSEVPLHPFLFTLYPVFFLYSKNLDELQTAFVLVRPLIVLLSTTTLILALSYLYFRKLDVAAVMATLFSLSSLTLMGGIVKLLMDWLHIGLNINAVLVYFAAYGVLLLGPIYLLVRAARIPSWVGLYMNVLACALLILPLTMLLPAAQRVAPVPPSHEIALPDTDAIGQQSQLPDVYFIILDGYARADVLREFFQFDNSPFLDAMKARGFFVAEQSSSRYPRTIESIAAMVSMDYLENLLGEDYESKKSAQIQLIQDNTVRSVFRRLGYTTMALESSASATSSGTRFDVVLNFQPPWNTLSQFEQALLKFSRLRRLFGFLGVNFEDAYWGRRVEFGLQNLDAPTRHVDEKPVFYQAHILSPHEPLVMLADGSFKKNQLGKLNPAALSRQEEPFDIAGPRYLNQLKGVNRHIENVVDRILRGSDVPPIIAIVSDHGPRVGDDAHWSHRDLGTLFMLMIPDEDLSALSHDVNNVELFPLILNEAFGFDLPMPSTP